MKINLGWGEPYQGFYIKMKHGLNVKKGNIPKMPNIFFVPRKQKQIEEIIKFFQ